MMLDLDPSPAIVESTAPAAFWELVLASLASVLDDARELLGHHLREDGYAPRGGGTTGHGAWCEITTGRSVLRLEGSFAPIAASEDEPALRAALGSKAPLVRIELWRIRGATRRLESVIAAQLASRRWACTDPPAGPHGFHERDALERCLWSSIGDPP